MKKQRGVVGGSGKARFGERPRVVGPAQAARSGGRSEILIAAALAVATLAVYGQVISHQFINLDDDLYIRNNPMVIGGLTPKGITWAFTTFHSANWHPLTWLSHMADSQLFGLNAGGHLLVNALIHVSNTLLLFFFLKRVTGASWRSAIVAALFALHPLHVESVAWAAERKDTLATFFGLLSLLAYARYAESASWERYALVALWLSLGLMAKPMLVTWPFVMLLLDYWPLRRLEWRPADGIRRFLRAWLPLVREKLPLLCLVAASMVVTYVAQSRGGAVRGFVDAPLSLRLSNALLSYAKYLLLTVWPSGLAVYYPFSRSGAPEWQIAAALVVLAAITTIALWEAGRRPYLITGWLWFLGTLVPVIGLVQVGGQAMADRYHYIPSIGLFVALVFGLLDLALVWRIGRATIAAVPAAAVLILASLSALQISWWRDSVTLFERTLSVTSDNVMILMNMGMTLSEQGKSAEAIGYYNQALAVRPDSAKLHMQLGIALAKEDRRNDALQQFYTALQLAPNDSDVCTNLGLMLARVGRLQEGADQLNEALRLNPNSAEAHNNLGLVLLTQGRPEESLPHFSAALRLKPDLEDAADNLRRAQRQLDAQQK